MDFYWFMNEFVFSFLEGMVILLVFLYITNNRKFVRENKVKSLIFLLWYTILSYWATAYIPTGIHTLCISFFLVITLSFITQTSIYLSIITNLITLLFISIVDSSVLLTMVLLKYDLKSIMTIPDVKIYASIGTKLLEFIIIYFAYKKSLNVFKKSMLIPRNPTIVFIIFQIYIMGITIASVVGIIYRKGNIALYSALLLIIYLLFIAINVLDYKERERILKVQSKFQAQEEHVRHLETVIDFIRREKHDFANHLNTIHIMSKIGKPDSITKIADYTTKLTHDLSSTYQFYNTGNVYIDGLLAVKSNVAHEMGITLQVDFEAPLSQVEVSESDLTSIVGNIVDNAFEAVSRRAGAQSKVVSISSYVEGDKYYLTISNNGPMISEKTLEKIFESGFSTKTDNKADHGYGLYIVKQVVEREKGMISVSSSEDETVFEVGFKIAMLSV